MPNKPKQEILEGLTVRQQKYIEGKLNGKSGQKAGEAAGYSVAYARNSGRIETPDVKAAFAELLRQKIPARRIVQRLKEGLDAKKTVFFQHNGIVTGSKEYIDFKERREYSSLNAQMAGYWTPKQEVEHSQTLDEKTAQRILDLSERLGLSELDFEQRKTLRASHVTLELQAQSTDSEPVAE